MAVEIGNMQIGAIAMSGAHTGGAHMGGAHTAGAHMGGAHMSGAHTGMAHMGGAHTGMAHMGATQIAGHEANYLGGAAQLSSAFGSMSPVGMGNIDIDSAHTGGWDTNLNAGYFNPSFGYAFPTGVGAIGIAGAHTGGAHMGKVRKLRRQPRQLIDVFMGRDKRNVRSARISGAHMGAIGIAGYHI